ncbi:hypothetical protein CXF72_05340 [Psychromonas sp. MB-3u-54]|uniref:hypothetical protein n=1 Tax=Psychromonas sp. MB-3u-54 TaxID=2058319 RepID=UPI000C344D79|nr:hypothetical protein [Psychromonas sp. MB-3u-54]PKH03634.1 hypothetical protein CXF72_05340 [Psychromonas sp. MB-3u-54]
MNKILFILLLFLSRPLFAVEGQLYIQGKAVKTISLSLGTSSIDFGDVYQGRSVDSVPVDFYVNAESGYDYTVEISNDDSSGVLQMSRSSSSGYTADSLTYIKTATGADQRHEFYVDLATENISSDLSAIITVMAVYNDIAE